jgi:branched-chain amino acid transport system substrate-binding protein
MTRIANSGAQACICFASGTPFGTILRGYIAAGLTMPMASSTGNMVYSQMQQYQSMGTQQLYIVGFIFNARGRLPRGPVRDQVESFYNAFRGTSYRPDAGSGAIWDAARILMTALHDLGSNATAPQVRDYIERLRAFPGIDGMYDFTQTPHRGLNYSDAVVTRWDPVNNSWIAMTSGGG